MSRKKPKKIKSLISKLPVKYKLVVLREDSLEERYSFRLSRLNVFVAVGSAAILFFVAAIFTIALTPLKEYIPGYAEVHLDKKVRDLFHLTDSMEVALQQKANYLNNIKLILEDKIPIDSFHEKSSLSKVVSYDTTFHRSKEDSVLRAEYEDQEQFNLVVSDDQAAIKKTISSIFFFAPVKGVISEEFKPKDKHYGIDIIANKNEAIKATLDGVVIFSDWTLETGYTIGIQHYKNIVSIYKHNSALFRKNGDIVSAGEVIAIIGGSGEMSSGPHLHFEIWHNGNPINPSEYMTFK